MEPTNACRKCSTPLELEAPASEENTSPNVREEPPVVAEGAAVRKKNQKPTALNFTEDHYAAEATTSKRDTARQTHTPIVKKANSSETGKISQFFETTIRLKETLEEDVELDHPLCVQCCDTLIETVDQKVKETEDEIRDERLYLMNLDSKKDEDEEESIEELQAELARVEAEERKLIRQFDKIKFEREITLRGKELLNRELLGLEKSLERETRDYSRLKNQWFTATHELTSLENRYAYFCHRRNILNETNTFERMFRIECDDQIGVINGFRLGSLTTCPVSWQEINFAWGEAVFLLTVLAEMFEFDFKKYVLRPLGDRSRIEMPERKFEKLPLHCFGENECIFPARQLFRHFDAGQVAFMECLSLLERGIRHRFRDFKLRHPISRNKIFEPDSEIAYSIEYDVNTRDVWTKALKCVLVNLEQILTFCIKKGVRTKLAEVPEQND